MIAALYIDPRGPYPRMPDVDCWDERRDARKYEGPYPVVAHPPCGPWGKLRHLCTKQDSSCGPVAVDKVREFGGVLEHPAHSRLFVECGMPRTGELPDPWGGGYDRGRASALGPRRAQAFVDLSRRRARRGRRSAAARAHALDWRRSTSHGRANTGAYWHSVRKLGAIASHTTSVRRMARIAREKCARMTWVDADGVG